MITLLKLLGYVTQKEKKLQHDRQKLGKKKKHGTLTFIIGNIVTGIKTFVQKSRKVEKEKTSHIVQRVVNTEA